MSLREAEDEALAQRLQEQFDRELVGSTGGSVSPRTQAPLAELTQLHNDELYAKRLQEELNSVALPSPSPGLVLFGSPAKRARLDDHEARVKRDSRLTPQTKPATDGKHLWAGGVSSPPCATSTPSTARDSRTPTHTLTSLDAASPPSGTGVKRRHLFRELHERQDSFTSQVVGY